MNIEPQTWIDKRDSPRFRWGALLGSVVIAMALVGCQAGPAPVGPTTAVAQLEPTQGFAVRGTVRFTQVADGVHIEAEVKGLVPGLHGFHVHEKGDCSAPDASSAGAHYNPHAATHGSPLADAHARHAGDLGNLASDPGTGDAVYDRIDSILRLDGDESIVGRAVIVHAGEDDLRADGTSTGGARIACGVIRAED